MLYTALNYNELKVSACTFFSCNRQAGTLATRSEVRENHERDTISPVIGPVDQQPEVGRLCAF